MWALSVCSSAVEGKAISVIDVMKSYVALAAGIAEPTATKALEATQGVVSQGMTSGTKAPEQMVSQVSLIAEDLMAQSKTNRELIVGLVRTEVERAVGRVGFVREEELAAVRAHVDRLEAQIRETLGGLAGSPAVTAVTDAAGAVTDAAGTAADEVSAAAGTAGAVARSAKTLAETTAKRKLHLESDPPADTDHPAETVVVRRPSSTGAAKKAAVKKTTAKKAPLKKAPVKKAPVKKATAKTTPANKATAKKAPAKKAAAKKATAKQAAAAATPEKSAE